MKKLISAFTILLSLNSFAAVSLNNAREGDPSANISIKANPSVVDAGINAVAGDNCPACTKNETSGAAQFALSTRAISQSSSTPNKVAPALDNNDPVNIGR